jgi:hypothetical protein
MNTVGRENAIPDRRSSGSDQTRRTIAGVSHSTSSHDRSVRVKTNHAAPRVIVVRMLSRKRMAASQMAR